MQHEVHDIDPLGLWTTQLLSDQPESALKPLRESPVRLCECLLELPAAWEIVDADSDDGNRAA